MKRLSPRTLRNGSIAFAGSALVAGALVGAALWEERGPGLYPLPGLVAVTMSDGHVLQVQTHEVTVADWMRCHDAGGCSLALRPPPGSSGDYPATGISHADAGEYIDWINRVTGSAFRLPSVAEWLELAAPVLPEAPDPIFTDPALTWASAYLTEGLVPRRLQPSGSFSTTDTGIADLDGNVWEWTQDCLGGSADRCAAYHVAGLHLAAVSYLERDPARGGCAVGAPPAHLGLRLVSDDRG